MIYVGCTSWGDHPTLYSEVTSAKDKLFDYSGHFPTVEVDTSFYAIPNPTTVQKWCDDTPDNFKFIVKAYQGMTGHLQEDLPFETKNDMYNAFRECLQTFQKNNKLAFALFQFPPWFDCQAKHVNLLKYIRLQFQSEPVAIEFRNQTWFSSTMKEKTLQFLKEHQFIHTICDEPQAGAGSVPFVEAVTNEIGFLRIHGRNVFGWRNIGHGENWRKVRFLYDYTTEELLDLTKAVKNVKANCKEMFVVFNNNSGGHAADNAKKMLELLNIEYDQLSPKQLNFFEGD
jgi:uncharacterized protein YecE (DUF72 family)